MGATPWQHLAPWDSDPSVALRELQASFLAENYDFPRVINEHLRNARESVRAVEEDGDEYQLLDIYRADLEYLEEVVSTPLPTTPEKQIAILRKVWESGGQGIGNILDVEGVSDEGGIHITRPISAAAVAKTLGTPTPTPREAERYLHLRADDLGRGESVCFPVYDDASRPCGWWFVGYTID